MSHSTQFYINGEWVEPVQGRIVDVVNPAREEPFERIALGAAADVDKAVGAARTAFETYSETSRAERLALLEAVLTSFERRLEELAQTISREMGAPIGLARSAQAPIGVWHLKTMIAVLKDFEFSRMSGKTAIVHEPIGVCGLITPWNWPINQIMCKVAPALAAGCTMVLKPSEIAPMNAMLVAEVLHEAGVPPGVFNLVNGDGPGVGESMSSHPGIDMMSFTGSTRAGIAVARSAATTVKRVTQELGGKGANIILEDADLGKAVAYGVSSCFNNAGQSCNAPTRMFVPRRLHDKAAALAKAAAESVRVGDPFAEGTTMGPVVSRAQYDRVQSLIGKGIDEGATLLTGGLGRPEGMNRGYFVRPTIFADVAPEMTIAREEVFGPVLSILPYDSDNDAIRMANDTVYGLSNYVQSGSLDRARAMALRLRSGDVRLNAGPGDMNAPFGGYKQSGNGREWGEFGLLEFLEVKAIIGWD